MEELRRKEIIGTKHFEGVIDITDPCYDKDTWCRMNAEVKSGEYDCITWIDTEDERVATIGIYLQGVPDDSRMEEIGKIGVDAGLAGFFMNKPDYTREEWRDFCNSIREGNAWIKEEGFLSESGWGDGMYRVYANKDADGKIVALEILFM